MPPAEQAARSGERPARARRPLEGVRVLDLTRALAGPYCTMILADLGADVIKVEPAAGGDMSRFWGAIDHGTSTYFLSTNRNKRSLAVDFRSADGLDLIRDIARRCDVAVENFKPGSADAMGLGAAALRADNPRLIYASISGFGRDGPAAAWPGFDQVAQGYSGFMSVTGLPGGEPLRVGVAIGDLAAGMWTAMGVLAALVRRAETGAGDTVETSLLAGLMALLSVQGQRYLTSGEVPERSGNAHPVIAPYGVFEAADGPLVLAPGTTDMWRRLCELLGAPELLSDPRFATNEERARHRDELQALIEAKLKERPRSQWMAAMIAAGIPAGPIHSLPEVFADAQVAACGLVEEVAHPVLGSVRQVGSPVRLGSAGRTSVRRPPPLLGEDTAEVLRDLGFADERIAALAARGTVASFDTLPPDRRSDGSGSGQATGTAKRDRGDTERDLNVGDGVR